MSVLPFQRAAAGVSIINADSCDLAKCSMEVNMIYHYSYDTEIGQICLAEEDGALIRFSFLNPIGRERRKMDEESADSIFGGPSEKKETELLRKARRQLEEYLEGNRKEFELSLAPQGTTFQKKVWDALREIPYGETRSYKEIALRVGNEKACRAVGMANNRNPIAVFIPCHRVIGSGGSLVGYAGGLNVKEKLLGLEQLALSGK